MNESETKKYATIAVEAISKFEMKQIGDGLWEAADYGMSITKNEDGSFVLEKAVLIPSGGSPYMGWWPDDVDFITLGSFASLQEATSSAMIEAVKIKFVEQSEIDFYSRLP